MSAALPSTVKHEIAVGHMSKGRVVKGIEQEWSARGDGKFAAVRRLLSSTPVLGIALQPLYFTLAIAKLTNKTEEKASGHGTKMQFGRLI